MRGAPSNDALVRLLEVLRKGEHRGLLLRLTKKLSQGAHLMMSSLNTLGRASMQRFSHGKAKYAAGDVAGKRFSKNQTIGVSGLGGARRRGGGLLMCFSVKQHTLQETHTTGNTHKL